MPATGVAKAALVLSALLVQATSGVSEDEEAIRQLMQRFATAWNRGDAKAIAELWEVEGVYTLTSGGVVSGRDTLEKRFAEALGGKDKGSRRQISVKRIRFVRPDVAVVDGAFEVTGGSIPRKSGYTFVASKEEALWHIAVWHVFPVP